MASALQKLLRKPPIRFITPIHSSQPPNPFNPIIDLHRECHPPTPPTSTPSSEQFPGSTVIFPSFPFGFASKPIFESGFCPPEAEKSGLEDSKIMWADSVKKKRKKKMNKHKYQKLRKRMRRQT
ncbi:hypothetical protein TanjilG_06027 [Lupinus angustifolius]|uniref:Small ribosomal subunit protein mS38 n=1 Tax=Lupinus angustifolius TaxID=3871 RepID=A0A4P1RJP7_LUPAN|nr:PREDICTED: uncharacterized protein LOC109347138 [Lupinus angustifolius]OIW12238.1 hypothetical protein TanjilG_06027 [Lupinus angustifolius]